MIWEWALIGAALAKDVKQNSTMKQKTAKLVAQGAFMESDWKRHDMIFQDYYNAFYSGDDSFIPEEYRPYLHMNPKALRDYLMALTAQQEYAEGLRPYMCLCFDREVFEKNKFSGFNYRYADYIKIYNETGKYYC